MNERLHLLREELCGGSNKEFAMKVGIGPQTASALCTGRRQPSPELLEKILKAFPQIRREWLTEGEGEMLAHGAPASGWTTSLTAQPDELQNGSVTLPNEMVEVLRRQAESLREKDEQLSKLLTLLEEKIGNLVKIAVDEDGKMFVKLSVDC